ncbi:unnamed protein product [Rotaria sp. Silwood1]|nr:unnamed protein product [Rotaria sp. Silwood1]CAF3401543.1 unnamed protein product [Rotaria sp. Silwood1]CAF4712108.1 unnamed protein product [Rotaria sp. Silwood1]CAF4824868.1 unnamed protein product [Rotaria sp. Silwood1]
MSSYQTAPYTHFHELVDTWTKHAQAIETQVKNLSEKARVLGTSSDTPEIRSRLDEDERRLHNLATKTKTVLKELADEMTKRKKELSRNDLDMVTKVKTAMINALKNYEDAITSVSKRRQQYQSTSNDTLIDFENANLSEDDVHRRLQLQQQMKMNNNLLIRQNEEQFAIEEQVQLVQADVIEINHMMRDIGAIVSEQSPIIAGIEQTVTTANDNIIAGNQQLLGASRHQKKYRKKLCWLLLIFLVIAVIVAIVIIIKLKT